MRQIVKYWLLAGMILLFFQIFIGGVTRLTGSGLSITKWEIVTGTIPPLSENQWDEVFNLYKATPQYEKLNEGMSMAQFKFIYFWEYLHRLWARMMGLIFIVPFFVFLFKGWLNPKLIRQLLILVGLAAVVAVFGWIMVASGLIDRPWVNAYKLTWHLSLALVVFSYMAWIVYESWWPDLKRRAEISSGKVTLFLILLAAQIMIGGIMSGSKAGLSYPSWPDMNGSLIPDVLFDVQQWKWQYFIDYDTNSFFPAFVQFVHRSLAYLLLIYGIYLCIRMWRSSVLVEKKSAILLGFVLVLQVILGIWTVINCVGQIPVGLGVAHQAVAVCLLAVTVWVFYISDRRPDAV